MKKSPLVSIIILTYNRIEILKKIIRLLLLQSYKNIEIIIIDNNSSDNTPEILRKLYPKIKIISLKSNIGVSALNFGLEAATGEYILQLDDDSYPENLAIEKGINHFLLNNRLGIVAFKIINLRYNFCETENFEFHPKLFNGCGVMFRKIIFNKTGYYNSRIFIYFNEIELSAKCYNAGFDIIYLSSVIVYHLQTIIARKNVEVNPFQSEFKYYHYFLSYSIFLLSNFSTFSVLKYTFKLILSNLIIAIFYKYWFSFFKVTGIVVFSLKSLFTKRNILSKECQKFYNHGNFALIDRKFFPNFINSKVYLWKKK